MFNSKGFSLIEVVIAMGLLGASSLVFMQMNKNQVVSQKRTEETVEIVTISSLIRQSLSDSSSCLSSIGVGTNISPETPISSINNIAGDPIVRAGMPYGEGLIEVLSMKILSASYGAPLDGRIKGSASLEVVFKKSNKIVQGKSSSVRSIRKLFPFNFVADLGLNMTSCYSSLNSALDSSLSVSCESLGGVLDVSNNCILKNYDSSSVSLSDAVSFKAQKDFLDTTLDSRFVNVDGDTVNGNLTVSGDITSNSQICINGRCRDFSRVACQSGEVPVEIKTNGDFVCRNLKSVLAEALCPSGDEISLSAAADGSVVFCDNGCSISSWTPGVGDICNGVVFNQSSNCNTTRSATGTKTTQECAPVPACSESDLTAWSPLPSSACLDEEFDQTRAIRQGVNCVNSANYPLARESRGTKTNCCKLYADPLSACHYYPGGIYYAHCVSQCQGSSVTQSACNSRSSGRATECTCNWQQPTCSHRNKSNCLANTSSCYWSP